MKNFINYLNPFKHKRVGRARFHTISMLYLLFAIFSYGLLLILFKESKAVEYISVVIVVLFYLFPTVLLEIRRIRDLNLSG